MKKNLIIYLVVSLGMTVSKNYGQQAYSTSPENPIISFATQSTVYDDKAKGSPYLNENFQYGEVEINDKLALTGKMRFNAYRNEVEILEDNKDDAYYSLLKRSYIKVRIGDKPYNIYQFKDKPGVGIRTSYFIELNAGPVVLLFKPEAKLKKGRTPSTSYDKYVPPTYVWSSSYYLVNKDNGKDAVAVKVRLNKKDFLRFFGESNQKELVDFIKAKELKVKHEEDAIKLVEFYNDL